ncbi:phage integrase N-terminal SAM-like domain-containing protein [Psychromonas sp. MB-3u-54]|uniref:phage integrase N-terminal SAM-like domain-containing protein n=1 Tax=Psychromonas sp. MB-3u-54 TaxID=2058319 RepID=UPI003FA6B44A
MHCLTARLQYIKHSKEMGSHEVEGFLNHLAVNKKVNSSTQNFALYTDIYLTIFS